MRRAREREMEVSHSTFPNKFYNKVIEIPIVKFGVEHASGFYERVKTFNGLTVKSFSLAESMTGAVVGRVTTPILANVKFLDKIDDFAVSGLEKLEGRVAAINKAPDAILHDVTTTVNDAATAVKTRVTLASDAVLISKPIQTYFDLLEFMLMRVENTLDVVLPEEDEKKNSVMLGCPAPENRGQRGWWLLGRFFGLLSSSMNRIKKKVYNRIEKTSEVVDVVFNEARRGGTNQAPTDNGEVKPAKKNKKNTTE